MRGATTAASELFRDAQVSIHAPHAGRDHVNHTDAFGGIGFNPRAPCGARQTAAGFPTGVQLFQSTRPMRGATKDLRWERDTETFQSTRPMRGATSYNSSPYLFPTVSIHAPHAGRDEVHRDKIGQGFVSIHAPHAGRDRFRRRDRAFRWCFNPRAPCGARHVSFVVERFF